MSNSILDDGGDFQTRKVGPDQYEMHIPIPTNDGLVGRECPNAECSPGYFKVKLGTGLTEGQVLAYCPYCRQEGEPNDFTTQAQIDYALSVLKNEVVKGIDKSFQKALGLGSSHKKHLALECLRWKCLINRVSLTMFHGRWKKSCGAILFVQTVGLSMRFLV